MKMTKEQMQNEMDAMKDRIAEQKEQLVAQDKYINQLVIKLTAFRNALKESLQ